MWDVSCRSGMWIGLRTGWRSRLRAGSVPLVFDLGGALAFVAGNIDGADRIGVALAGEGGGIAPCRGDDRLAGGGDALRRLVCAGTSAIDDVSGEAGIDVGGPVEIDGFGRCIRRGDQANGNRRRED